MRVKHIRRLFPRLRKLTCRSRRAFGGSSVTLLIRTRVRALHIVVRQWTDAYGQVFRLPSEASSSSRGVVMDFQAVRSPYIRSPSFQDLMDSDLMDSQAVRTPYIRPLSLTEKLQSVRSPTTLTPDFSDIILSLKTEQMIRAHNGRMVNNLSLQSPTTHWSESVFADSLRAAGKQNAIRLLRSMKSDAVMITVHGADNAHEIGASQYFSRGAFFIQYINECDNHGSWSRIVTAIFSSSFSSF